MNGVQYITDGILTNQWDDDSSTYTEWDLSGNQVRSVPYSTLQEGDSAYEVAQDASARVAAVQAAQNRQSILSAIRTQHANNLAYLGLAAPTNAQVIEQVAALTRQSNGLMRLEADDLTGTN